MPAIQWASAWLVLLLILYGISQSKAGHTITYYVLWLAVVFLVVSHYSEINTLFQQGGF